MYRLLRTRVLGYCSGRPRSRPVISSKSASTDAKVPFADVKIRRRADADAPSRLLSRLLKIGTFASIAVTSYVSYAYTLDEVDQMTRAIRTISNYRMDDAKSGLDKFKALIYSSFTAIPVELYMDMRRAVEEKVRCFNKPSSDKLLPDLPPDQQHVFTLVLDLNETLAYSDWEYDRGWRTLKRPGVDDFLDYMAGGYELVLYSDLENPFVDPVIKRLILKGCITHTLSRSANRYVNGKYYRDLSVLNRDPSRILYISGRARETCLQPENCVPITPWRNDPRDTYLSALVPFLEYVAIHRPADIRSVLASYQGLDIPSEFVKRAREHQRRVDAERSNKSFFSTLGRLWTS